MTAKNTVFPHDDAIPAEFRLPEPVNQTEFLLGGKIRSWDGPFQEVVSPIGRVESDKVRPRVIGSYPKLGSAQAVEALDAACEAYDRGRGPWPTMSVEQRIRHVEAFTHAMVERRDTVVRLLMWEICKNLADSRKEFDRTVDYIRDTVAALKELDRASSRFVIEQGVMAQVRRAPLGVTLCMGPFNYPLNETFTTLIPALIMGNTVVFKPPKHGALIFGELLSAFRDSFPPGVVNTVYGSGREVVGPLMESGRIDVLAFIGSSGVASELKHKHPHPHRLRSVLGLEAKNAAIVMDDADVDHAVRECALGSLSFNGQRCTAIKMIFIQDKIADEFLEKFCRVVEELPCGMPWDDGVKITPLPEEGKMERLAGMVEDATSRGARVLNPRGGHVNHTLMRPSVVFPVQKGMRLYEEEQFGPIVPVKSFSEISEPMNYVVESSYGQQVALFGSDPDKIAELVDPLVNQVCRVNINSQCQRGPDVLPFTGRKDSAEGTLSVSDALRVFTIRTLAAAKETDANKGILKSILTERSSRFLSTDFIF